MLSVSTSKVLSLGKEVTSDLVSDGCKVKLGDVPHHKSNGAGEPKPILSWGTHACLKFRHLCRQLLLIACWRKGTTSGDCH